MVRSVRRKLNALASNARAQCYRGLRQLVGAQPVAAREFEEQRSAGQMQLPFATPWEPERCRGRRMDTDVSAVNANLVSMARDAHLRVVGRSEQMLAVAFMDGPDAPIVPGGQTYATVKFLDEPGGLYEDLVEGTKFELLEGSQVVGTGRVTRR